MTTKQKFDPSTIGYWSHAFPIGTVVRHATTGERAEVFGYRKLRGVILIDVIEPGTHVGKWSADASWLPILTKDLRPDAEPTLFDLLFDHQDDYDDDPGYTDWLEKQHELEGN